MHKDGLGLHMAGNMANESKMRRHKMGAAILTDHGDWILGFNKHKTHPRFKTRSIHAEMDALLMCARNGRATKRATIYVARRHRDGTPAIAKPCDVCMQLLHHAGVERAVWTTDTGHEEFILG